LRLQKPESKKLSKAESERERNSTVESAGAGANASEGESKLQEKSSTKLQKLLTSPGCQPGSLRRTNCANVSFCAKNKSGVQTSELSL